jgi:serine phosphatase RsbU (regulator of sigma subunit)
VEQFGQQRLAELLLQNTDLAAPDILQAVLQGINVFGNNRSLVDDVTMIAMKISD